MRSPWLVAALAFLALAGAALLVEGGRASEALLGSAVGGGDDVVVPFDAVAAAHFRALAVDRDEGPAGDRALVVRLRFIGEAPDLQAPIAWLAENAGVVVVEHPDGAPVVFVEGDLATQRGREALGATIPRGMAIETRERALVDCVFAHEVLHFLGLRHVEAEQDIMHPRCHADKPDAATLGPEDQEVLDRLQAIHAVTLTGRVTWAERV